MPPRRRTPVPGRPDGTYPLRKPKPPAVCDIDNCDAPAALYAAGNRCPTHKPDHEKYLAAWLAGCHQTPKEPT